MDGSFFDSTSGNSLSISSAWLALNDDNLILESSSDVIPTTYPSARTIILGHLDASQRLLSLMSLRIPGFLGYPLQ
ncbi:hypothetical protein RhiirA5_439552 [Rhizophagus irregularis]|uniref:Uncharacterized protein n=1 Tax=Rhizophagus irregularis TaxID=588596 RepID=A0A2N0NHR1_9GLOM|nr:hypothetical protein RhiirA5_439552 [Rhizophagus irregularis]